MSIFIEGLAFPLDVLNVNGWGVPKSEASNAIASLKTSVIRVCNRIEAHLCDFFEDPYSEIGRIVDAWEQDGEIWAKGIITDSAAESKIIEKTWEKNWSVYAFEESNIDGFSQGFQARSMTLVRFPAWENSQWDIATAAAKNAAEKKQQIGRSSPSTFTIIKNNTKSACSCNKNKGGKNMAEEEAAGDPIQEILKRLDALEKAVMVKPEEAGDNKEGLSASVKELSSLVKASIEDLEKKNKEQEKVIASLEKDKAVSVPAKDLPEMIAAAIKEAKDTDHRAATFARFAAVRKEKGLETKEEDFKSLTAEDLERSITELETLRPVSGAQYPQGGATISAGANTGIYDPFTKSWKV